MSKRAPTQRSGWHADTIVQVLVSFCRADRLEEGDRLSLLTSQNDSFASSKALQKPADGDMAVRPVSIQFEYRGSPKQIHLRGCHAWRCHNSGHSVNSKVKRNRDVLWPAGLRNRCKREGVRRRVKGEVRVKKTNL